ncbi:four-carbon acid sugar kinase family protein [Oceanobacillus bengalensis]|uniref:Four-carbon acid sugar kinase family protein n=1 Tax=Oceanobacillus bengalensis TaxID=1435466 RepID=A0A494YZD5_9BACI|nr:four-carbon acid sugar kinase family protein [Oceanobacillus bengalensis]RKQ15599.1 hypothetical protein D8M05_10040 [Oceanobacillus bengalensis]
MNRSIGIIADDLTGANDSGIQFTKKGMTTSVYFQLPSSNDNLDNSIVIDTNSRALLKEEAISATRQASLFLKNAGYKHIYKKMDSTLRGHIGSELMPLREVFHPELVVIAPAFPSLGRTTRNGIHYVNGEEITETEFSRDPKHPVTTSYIPELIQNETGEVVGLITKSMLEEQLSTFREKIQAFINNKVTFVVCDAESEEDLLNAAIKIDSVTKNVIWAGSAGLAEVLPEVLGIHGKVDKPSISTTSQVMTVCGSLSQVTQNQVKFAISQSNVSAIRIDTTQIFQENWKQYQNDYINECLKELKIGKDIVIYVPSDNQVRELVQQIGKELGLSGNQIGERISGALGQIVTEVYESYQNISGLVLIGGDTSKDTLKNLGGIGIRLIKQVEAGIPLGSLIGIKRVLNVVTKAGAFGKENSIYHAMQDLKGVNNND